MSGRDLTREGLSNRGRPPPLSARLAAAGALVTLGLTLSLLVVATAGHAGDLAGGLVALASSASALWILFTNRRWRLAAVGATIAAIAGETVALLAAGAGDAQTALVLACGALSGGLGAAGLRLEVDAAVSSQWQPVPAALHPVLLINPLSGGGKAERFHLAEACAARGIDVVTLGPGSDLLAVAESAAAGGADVIGMAGGDGSQATVAAVAARNGVAYVCVPAGTRNHLALDLGVKRDDVVGALDAFGPALERPIDLASVNGRVFVNNVSLGLYAAMVASADYRREKLKTAAQTIERFLGPDPPPLDLHLHGPHGPIDGPQIIEVSNNPYALASLTVLGTRPRLDTGTLGVVTVAIRDHPDLQHLLLLETSGHAERFEGLHVWASPGIEVRSDSPIAAGIDGETAQLESTLRFVSHPGALRVRVARGHPGASAAMQRAPLASSTVAGLWSLVRGHPSGLAA